MARMLLLVGTRKGCFILESGEDRGKWELRGPFCEGWPVYHAIYDEDSGSIYASAASEWHGSALWRSPDLGETWEHSSEGLGYPEGELKLSKISTVTAAHGRLLVGAEAAGLFESRDGGQTFSLLTTLDDLPGRDKWNNPDNQPPGHLGLSAILPHPTDPERLWVIVQGHSIFETTDGGETWAPRNKGLRADWPQENPEVGYYVHKLVLSPTDHDRMYQQNHVGMHRRTTPRSPGWRSPRGCRPSSASPPLCTRTTATASTSSRSIPATPGPCPTARLRCGARATRAPRGATRPRPAAARRVRRCSARMAIDSLDTPGVYLARAPARCSRAPTKATAGTRSRATCLASPRSRWRRSPDRGRRLSAPRRCPALPRPRTPRGGRGGDGAGGDRTYRRALAGPSRPACELGHGIRRHINVYVDRERAELDAPVGESSRVDVIAAIGGG